MDEKLQELAQYSRQTLPQPKAISHLEVDPKGAFITFSWHARRFVVIPPFDVLELRGDNLYITGASRLLQAAFTKHDKNGKVLAALDETFEQIEDFVSYRQVEKALNLLEVVKRTLEKLAMTHAGPIRKLL